MSNGSGRPLYPCLWFDKSAREAADFYCSIFPNARILSETPMVTMFELNGTRFMGLTGGDHYCPTHAVSYYVYCSNKEELTRIYDGLTQEGSILMPMDRYDWSEQYAWVSDRFGISWQLDMADIPSGQKIVPSLLFAGEQAGLIREAISRYSSIFPGSELLFESPFPPDSGLPEGTLLFAQFRLNGLIFNAMSSIMKHDFDFTPGNSFVIECDTQEEIDHYWERLGEGGRYEMCGWLADRYGVSWQIFPAKLWEWMADPVKGERVVQAFLKIRSLI